MATERTLPLGGDVQGELMERRELPAVVKHDLTTGEGTNPLAMLQRLIERGADPESLGKMMDLAERFEAREAKRLWAEAVAAFKSELLPVAKTNAVQKKDGSLLYHFASYADVKTNTLELERKHGIVTSYSFEQGQGDKMIGTLKVTVGSHTETTTLPIPITQGQNTNAAQNYGVTVTYCKRYLYCNAFDIVIRDDSDGRFQTHDNPEPDPEAPVTPPRGKRQPPQATTTPQVDFNDTVAIIAAWKDRNPDMADNTPKNVAQYVSWVKTVCKRDFNPLIRPEWTPADVAACRKALVMEGA